MGRRHGRSAADLSKKLGHKVDFFAEKNEVSFADLPDPEPGSGQVVVDVRVNGICHMGIEVLRGNYETLVVPWAIRQHLKVTLFRFLSAPAPARRITRRFVKRKLVAVDIEPPVVLADEKRTLVHLADFCLGVGGG